MPVEQSGLGMRKHMRHLKRDYIVTHRKDPALSWALRGSQIPSGEDPVLGHSACMRGHQSEAVTLTTFIPNTMGHS